MIVSNAGGSVTSGSLPLIVKPPVAPAITAQPVGGTLSLGNVASFRVTATGSPTPTYRWRKDGVAIAGATFTLASVQLTDAGT